MDNALSSRLDNLEHRLNFWRVLVIMLLILCATSIVSQLKAAPTRIEATTVVAHQFELVNGTGRVIGEWGSVPRDSDYPFFSMMRPNNKLAIVLRLDAKTQVASISTLGSDGQIRAMMSEEPRGGMFAMFDKDNNLAWSIPVKKSP
jgi:hypothetical protein